MRPVTSASNLFRRALCPGSARLEEGLPEEDSQDAREGKLLHDYAAHPEYQREVLKPEQRDLLELADSLTKQVIERVEKEGDLIGKITKDFHERTFSAEISGTPDLTRYYMAPGEHVLEASAILVIDRKFGYKVVERADVNLQLRAYAVLTWLSTATASFVAIVQPRLSYSERITIAHYTPQDIEHARAEIKDILLKTVPWEGASDLPKLVAGEEQCRYCKAKLICPEFRKTFKHLVPLRNGSLNLSKAAREAYLAKRLSECSDKELEKVLVACGFASAIKSQAHSEARRRITDGGFTNYYLGKEYSVREIADPQKAISLLTLAGICTREQLLAVCSIPIGKIEEEYRKTTGCTEKAARDKINKALASVIEEQQRAARVLKK